MNESPKQTPLDLPDEENAFWKAMKGTAVLSIAGFSIFGLSAFGWHMGVALADWTLRICG
jgi:hypothetical protein